MSYRNPAFMVAHPAASLPIASITPRDSTISDDSKRALIDSRQGELASFTATWTSSGFFIDFGSPAGAGTVNRALVPAGHNFDTRTLVVLSGPNAGSVTVRDSTIQSGSGVIDFSFADITSDQVWLFNAGGVSISDVFTLGEFWLGEYKELTYGDGRVDPGFEREYQHDVVEAEFGGRTTSLELSPPRRKFSLQVRGLDPDEADFATLEEVVASGPAKPFWYWPPDDTEPGPFLVKLTRSAKRVQGGRSPSVHMRYEVELEMLEQVT